MMLAAPARLAVALGWRKLGEGGSIFLPVRLALPIRSVDRTDSSGGELAPILSQLFFSDARFAWLLFSFEP
jgi:hypothetical protein